MVTNGVCVKKGYRNMGVLKFMADAGDLQVYRAGCDRMLTPVAAPETMCVVSHKGYEILASITYRDKDKPYALSDEEYASKVNIRKKFRDGEPLVTLVMKHVMLPKLN